MNYEKRPSGNDSAALNIGMGSEAISASRNDNSDSTENTATERLGMFVMKAPEANSFWAPEN